MLALPTVGSQARRDAVAALSHLVVSRHCDATQRHLGRILQIIGAAIDRGAETWGACTLSDLHELNQLGRSGRKRRRLDPHVRMYSATGEAVDASSCSAEGLRSNQFPGAASVREWQEQQMCAVQAGAHLLCGRESTFCSIFDAARVGKPALDVLLHCVWLPGAAVSLVSPPVVPLICSGTFRGRRLLNPTIKNRCDSNTQKTFSNRQIRQIQNKH